MMKEPIKLEDIRVGDLIRCEWGELNASEYVVTVNFVQDKYPQSEKYFLIRERPVVLPTVPGYYVDCDGDVWKLSPSRFACLSGVEPSFDFDPEHYAPFTRLVPEV
jgi:hypothetical protein